MSNRRVRKRVSQTSAIARRAAQAWASVTRRPVQACFVGLLSIAATWAVVTKSLPYALAPASPDIALALDPNNPEALLVKAEELRTKLVALASLEMEKTKEGEGESRDGTTTLSHLPRASEDENDPSGERETLRTEIRNLALRALANNQLNAGAFRALAEVTDGTEQVRLLMQASLGHSRRDSVAAFWLLNDAYYHKNFREALRYSDLLLRTRPELKKYIFGYLSLIAEVPGGLDFIVERLTMEPAWRSKFFALLPEQAKNAATPLSILTALRDSGNPVKASELAPYLNFLISTDRIDVAYNAWLQFLPAAQLEQLGLLTNASFENKPSGVPFDWQIGAGVNAIADIVPLGNNSVGNALHIYFSDGRVRFPEVVQMLLLAHGRYRLEGKLRGAINGKRGLRWQMRCATGERRVLGETEMLLGESLQWRIFSLELDVPQLAECRGQKLLLFHDSRSASEELVSGEVWFSDLKLERIQTETAQWTPQP